MFLGKTTRDWLDQLESPTNLDRLAAVRALGEIARQDPNDDLAARAIVEATDHPDRAVRYWAVRSIGNLGKPTVPAVARLRKALDDTAPEVRVEAAYALGRQGSPPQTAEALAVLTRELRNPSDSVRLHAAQAMARLGEGARPVLNALREATNDDSGYVVRVANRVLRSLGESSEPAP